MLNPMHGKERDMNDGIYESIHVTEDDIIDYCKRKLRPEEVFSEKELDEWAVSMGYKKD